MMVSFNLENECEKSHDKELIVHSGFFNQSRRYKKLAITSAIRRLSKTASQYESRVQFNVKQFRLSKITGWFNFVLRKDYSCHSQRTRAN